ncbi:MAG: hypothetical protein ABIP12_03510 [Terriglobales bacterium]
MPDSRKLKLVERPDFVGWGCSNCAWVFRIPATLKSESLDDLIRETEAIRDNAFAAHACSSHQQRSSAKAGE